MQLNFKLYIDKKKSDSIIEVKIKLRGEEMKSMVLQDETLKDSTGSGKFIMKLKKNGVFASSSTYEIVISKNTNKNTVDCVMKREDGNYKYYKYNLTIDNSLNDIFVNYEINNNGFIRKFNLMENDLMLTAKIKREMLKILKEFDMTAWSIASMGSKKSTMIDIITDIIDLTEKNETVVDNIKYSDYELVNTVIDGYFNETQVNTDKMIFSV